MEFYNSIRLLTKLVTSQSHKSDRIGFVAPSSKVTRVSKFMRLNPPTFTGSKVEEGPEGFVEMEKIFRVMHAIDLEGWSLMPIN